MPFHLPLFPSRSAFRPHTIAALSCLLCLQIQTRQIFLVFLLFNSSLRLSKAQIDLLWDTLVVRYLYRLCWWLFLFFVGNSWVKPDTCDALLVCRASSEEEKDSCFRWMIQGLSIAYNT